MFRQCVAISLGLILLSLVTPSVYAHKVNVFAYAEGDAVYVQGYFSDGTKAKNSDVTVFTQDGREFVKGKTNEQGEFAFPTMGKPQALRIVLNAGLGHQSSFDIPMDEMTDVPATMKADPPHLTSTDIQTRADTLADASESGTPSQLSEAALRKAVAEGVLPLAREISELKERRGFSDIVGGIGFIVGILGVFAYLKGRQESRRSKETRDRADQA